MNPDVVMSPEILAGCVRALVPLILLGVGALICHQAGVFNVALEGLMLTGCFAAVAGSALTGNVVLAVLIAVGASTAVAYVLAVGAVSRHGDPLILGTAANLLVSGLTTFLLQAMFHVRGTYQRPDLARLPHWFTSATDTVPYLGPAIAAVSPLGVLAILAVVAVYGYLRHSVSGLRLRGVGVHPEAASSLGVTPSRYRFAALLVSGVLGGLAGAELSLGSVALFTEDMSAGRGWVLVLIMLLAGGRVMAVVALLILYAYAQALGFRLQTVGLPMQFSDAAPYVAILVAITWLGIRARIRARTARADDQVDTPGPISGVAAPASVGPDRRRPPSAPPTTHSDRGEARVDPASPDD
ncbi:nucleoside ABC transporter membrane protein [Williamsia sterculiae]|uniref:Nucleoside ABC transporter membrane protein n=1 Tax=Williamsia sterculiae TaxID=1344003 RepID=A0A1N7EJV6_9NOCA|nr:nucleoside ABC transporter membrane protein [Williamsia sterculiae]